MPTNILSKSTPRGRGPEPSRTEETTPGKNLPVTEHDKTKESDLAAQEIQDLWESQEIGITSWSGEGGNRYSDPN